MPRLLRGLPRRRQRVSIRYARRPVCSAAMSVEPPPPKRSSTFSPKRDECWIALTASSTGFSAMLNELVVKVERIVAGLIDPAEEHLTRPLKNHLVISLSLDRPAP